MLKIPCLLISFTLSGGVLVYGVTFDTSSLLSCKNDYFDTDDEF